jgi:copper transport protein
VKKWCAALGLAIAAAIMPATSVSAHASFESSNPIDGTVLETAPSTVTLDFSEDVLPDASEVTLLSLGTERSDELAVRRGDDGSVLLVSLPRLERGAYILRYSVVDPADLHRTVGSVSFGIGVAAPPSTDGEQIGGSVWTSLVRGVTDTVMLMGAGAAVLLWLMLGVTIGEVTRRRIISIVRLSAIAVAVGWTVLLLADTAAVGFGSVRWIELLTGSDPGRRALIGLQLAVGVWFGTLFLQRAHDDSGRRFLTIIIALCWLGMLTVAALGGHSGIGGDQVVGFVLRVVHLGALSLWVGTVGVAWLVSRRSDDHPAVMWRPVSRCAAVGLALTGVSGLLLSGRTVATITALFSSEYGRLLLVKVAALGLLAVAGLLAAERVAQYRTPHRRLLATELGLVVGVVLVAGFLSGRAPAVGEQYTPLVDAAPQVVTADLADLTASASVQPARPGANLLQLRLLDTRRPAPGPVGEVTVRVTDASGAMVSELSGIPVDGVVEWDSLRLPSPGEYHLTASIDRPALDVPQFNGTLSVSAAPVPRAKTVVSDQDLGPLVFWLAIGWVILVAAAARFVRSAR